MKPDVTPEAERAIQILETRWANIGPHNLPYHILLLGKLIDRATTQHVRDAAGLTLAEWRALAHLDYLKRGTSRQIANLALVDPAEVSRALGTLERRGLVVREANPRNRKSSLVSLTQQGRELHDALREERSNLFEHWVSDLTQAERTHFDSMLRSIIRGIIQTAPHMVSP
jgi:DNA-binding MarR family transcriptional regulator